MIKLISSEISKIVIIFYLLLDSRDLLITVHNNISQLIFLSFLSNHARLLFRT